MVKKGALELSVRTIVILVLPMSMLILGIVLIRNIFGGATNAVDLIDDNVKAQINSLFNTDENKKIQVYLPEHSADVEPGKRYNVQFAIKNIVSGVSGAQTFNYKTSVSEIEDGCQLTEARANSYIVQGRDGNVKITPGSDPVERTIVVSVPDGAPLCIVTYNIDVTQGGADYASDYFILTVSA